MLLFLSSLSAVKDAEYSRLSNEQQQQMLDFARSLMNENKLQEASVYFSDFIDLYPDSSRTYQAYEALAEIAEKQQNYQRAIRYYTILHQSLGQPGLKYLMKKALLLEKTAEDYEARKVYEEIAQRAVGTELHAQANTRLNLLKLLPIEDNQPVNLSVPTSNPDGPDSLEAPADVSAEIKD